MLRFSRKVFDDVIGGTQPVYSSPELAELLGSVDHLTLHPQMYGVSGTSPTLTVQVEHSCDGARWMTRNTAAELSTNLLEGQNTFAPVTDGSATARATLRFVRIRMQLGGTSPFGVLRLWVAGRDPAR